MFGIGPRFDVGIHQRTFLIVYPQSSRLVCSNKKFVLARIRRKDRPSPFDREFVRFDLRPVRLVGVGAFVLKVEGNNRINPLEHSIITTKVSRFEVLGH